MTAFDDLMRDADADIFDALGSNDCPLIDKAGTTHPVQAAIDHNLEFFLDGMGQIISTVITLNQPPAGVTNGWQVTVDGVQYELLDRLEKDGFISRWQGRRLA